MTREFAEPVDVVFFSEQAVRDGALTILQLQPAVAVQVDLRARKTAIDLVLDSTIGEDRGDIRVKRSLSVFAKVVREISTTAGSARGDDRQNDRSPSRPGPGMAGHRVRIGSQSESRRRELRPGAPFSRRAVESVAERTRGLARAASFELSPAPRSILLDARITDCYSRTNRRNARTVQMFACIRWL